VSTAVAVRELVLRGIGVAVVGMYVEDIGGKFAGARGAAWVYQGSGWTIELTEGARVRVGSAELGVTIVQIMGAEPVVEQIEVALSRKVLRAGG
jgi:hypothetical protein